VIKTPAKPEGLAREKEVIGNPGDC